MKQRPILFKSEMVQAILAGRKTMTRRVVKPSIFPHLEWMGGSSDDDEFDFLGLMYDSWSDENGKEMPAEWLAYCNEYPEEGVIPIGQGYGAVGDRLWVRETFSQCLNLGFDKNGNAPESLFSYSYKADGGALIGDRWKPSIHMPRWASRILLEITDIRVERLQDISEADAKAEGCCYGKGGGVPDLAVSPEDHFPTLWESINGVGSWADNPWVWVVEFKVVQGGDL